LKRSLVAALIIPRIGLPGIRLTRRREVRRRGATIISAASIDVRVRGVVAWGTVGVIVAAPRGRVIIQGWSATGRRPVAAPPVVIVVPSWGRGTLTVSIPVGIPTRAIAAGRAAPIIVINRGRISTAGRSRTSSVSTRKVRLSLLETLATGKKKD
jgi:hypothetical protein